MSVLQNDAVRDELRRAWVESQPGPQGGHEEGGFVLQQADGSLTIERWPRGAQDEIEVPPHPGGRRAGVVVKATFHTHPNTGQGYLPEPSPDDVQAVKDDPDLRHPEYEGEYVVSQQTVYQIRPDGTVVTVGDTAATLLAGGN